MERHIVEILVILMREYPEGAIRPDEFEPLTKDLIGLGYTQHEIETALFWFYNRQEVKEHPKSAGELDPGSFRVLHDVERSVIAPEAYGYLLELKQLGLISLSDLDAIIEKAVLLGGRKVEVEEVKMFVAAQIMDREGSFPLQGQSFYLKTPSDKVH